MSRASLLKVSALLGLVAALAACDAPSGALAPRELRPTPTGTILGGSLLDSLQAPPVTTTTSTQTVDEPTCRSGYQIAYRSDGTWYCEPVDGG